MHALVSLLDDKHDALVKELWQELEEGCGVKGIKITPFPHFSWIVAADFEETRIESLIKTLAYSISPFSIKTSGLGIFTGPSPVVYVPLVRDMSLTSLHNHLWDAFQDVGRGVSALYQPKNWIPHISLAHKDVCEENINDVFQRLAFQNFSWTIPIDNLALIYQPNGGEGVVKYRAALNG
jgi:2'-5' RNA ligase